MFTWFVLTKAGYKARIAYDTQKTYLLLPSQQQLFAAPYFTFDNTRYYALGFDGNKMKLGRVFTYDGHYPGATKRMDMRLLKPLIQDAVKKIKPYHLSIKIRPIIFGWVTIKKLLISLTPIRRWI